MFEKYVCNHVYSCLWPAMKECFEKLKILSLHLAFKLENPYRNKNTMKTKWPLFLGIFLLILGILLRKALDFPLIGLAMILFGVGLKTYYILDKVRKGEYRPGSELWFLFIGLALFFFGLYLKNKETAIEPLYLILTGIGLKIVFIIRFIRMTRTPHAASKGSGNP